MRGPAVLVIAFNRPHLLNRVLQALGTEKPSRVYVFVDGPRPGSHTDDRLTREVWNMLESDQWQFPMVAHRRSSNGGLGLGVIEAISWFFRHESSGVILEDDVVIGKSSLGLADSLLNYFRDVPDVGSISLSNLVTKKRLLAPGATYRFSAIPATQYWGTWKDRWQRLLPSLEQWRNEIDFETLELIGGSRFARHYASIMDEEVRNGFSSWEGRWIATHFAHQWKVATTNKNFSLHVGFGSEASNSTEQPSWYPTVAHEWSGPVIQPMHSEVERGLDRWLLNQRFGLSPFKRVKHQIGVKIPLLRKMWRKATLENIASEK